MLVKFGHGYVRVTDYRMHMQAQKLFLKTWQDKGLKVITLTGSADANKEADAYEAALMGLPKDVLPRNANGTPMFGACVPSTHSSLRILWHIMCIMCADASSTHLLWS